MGDVTGFLKHRERALAPRRAVEVRIKDWREIHEPHDRDVVRTQASRCMNCGVPFCNNGCPLGNVIPDWNHLVYRDQWREASERLHATNNFPEFTGRLCPAVCEGSCVLGIEEPPVAICQTEREIVERAWAEGWITPHLPDHHSGKRVAIVGSGPAGLAAAQQLTRAGHDVVVYERADRPGGLLRYGIPEFKLEKRILDRRLDQMRAEGTQFCVNTDVGVGELREDFDAVVLALGSTVGRDLLVPGRDLAGIHLAMEYLPQVNLVAVGDLAAPLVTASGRRVVIIGGGDTGADCLGAAIRQGAQSVHQLEILPCPPSQRDPDRNPWPSFPRVHKVSSAHEEGGELRHSVTTTEFRGDDHGHVRSLRGHEVCMDLTNGRPDFAPVPETEFELPCDLVLLAMGFVGPKREGLLEGLGVTFDSRGNVARDSNWMTSVSGVFACGDMSRGQSLIVWATAEGRSAASAVDRHLMGNTHLPAPITPTSRPM